MFDEEFFEPEENSKNRKPKGGGVILILFISVASVILTLFAIVIFKLFDLVF